MSSAGASGSGCGTGAVAGWLRFWRMKMAKCSVCGQTPAILVDGRWGKGTYWECGDCIFLASLERIALYNIAVEHLGSEEAVWRVIELYKTEALGGDEQTILAP